MTLTQRQMVDNDRSRFDFKDEIVYLTETKRGLTHDTVREISALKNEPEWMLEFRLRAYEHFLKRPMAEPMSPSSPTICRLSLMRTSIRNWPALMSRCA